MNGTGIPGADTLVSRPDPEIPRDEIFDVLSNARRRQVLHYLKRAENRRRVELRELVDHVAAWENEIPIEEVSATERKRVYTALRQSHLPKMADADVIEYDTMRGEVRLTDAAREAELYLEYVPNEDIPWSHCYLGLAGVCAALVGISWLGVYPLSGLSGHSLAVLVVLTFAVAALVHAVQSASNRIGTDEFSIPRERA